jgi:hypothetical protein
MFAHIVKAVAIASLLVITPFASADAKNTAPGIMKKLPLVISDVTVSVTLTSATVSWTTSKPSHGSIVVHYGFDAVGYVDEKFGTNHSVTVENLAQNTKYPVTIESHSDVYGSASPVSLLINTTP